MGRRPLFWEGSAKRDFKQFPEAVQKDMGVALFVVQLAGRHHLQNPGRGSGGASLNWSRTIGAIPIERFTWSGLLEGCMCCMRSRRSLSQGSRRHERMSNWSRRD
jgi:phage-related protein